MKRNSLGQVLGNRQMIGNQTPDAAGLPEASLPSSLKSGLGQQPIGQREGWVRLEVRRIVLITGALRNDSQAILLVRLTVSGVLSPRIVCGRMLKLALCEFFDHEADDFLPSGRSSLHDILPGNDAAIIRLAAQADETQIVSEDRVFKDQAV
jgi:hypothetical protein